MLRTISGPQMQLQSRHVGVRMSETLPLLIDRVETPIGEMLIVADREGSLRAVDSDRPRDTHASISASSLR